MIARRGKTRRIRICFGLIGLACLSLAAGCGKGTGSLNGKITYGDKPVKSGSVTVVGSDGVVHAGAIQEDGAYLCEGIPVGPVRIAVASPDPSQIKVANRKPHEGEKPKLDSTGWLAIPEKYGDINQSELTFTVKKGANTFHIELK